MNRKEFVKTTILSSAGFFIAKDMMAKPKGPIYGYNEKRFRLNTKWGNLNPGKTPVNDCHEMVQDSKGRILLLTNETKNNVLIYDKNGKLLETWGNEYPGAHGFTLFNENGEDVLFICDNSRHQVIKQPLPVKC